MLADLSLSKNSSEISTESPICGRPLTLISIICSGLQRLFPPCNMKVMICVPLDNAVVLNSETQTGGTSVEHSPSSNIEPSKLETQENSVMNCPSA